MGDWSTYLVRKLANAGMHYVAMRVSSRLRVEVDSIVGRDGLARIPADVVDQDRTDALTPCLAVASVPTSES